MRKQLPLFLFLIILFSISLISFSPPVKASSANFGYETAGGSSENLWNIIAGSVFACTEAGTADSITAYIKVGSTPTGGHDTYVKCAIYDSSLNLVRSTAQVLLPKATTGWRTFNFSDPKPSLSIANYWLVAWAEFPHATYSTWLYYNAGDANQGLTKATTYNGFPNPLVTPTYSSNKYSIYCTYTVSGGQTEWHFSNTFSLSPSITDGRRFSFSRQSSFSESFSYDEYRSFTISRKSIFSTLFSVNDGRLITLSRKSIFSELFSVNDRRLIILSHTSFFSQAFSIDTILSILKLNEYHFSTVITFSYSLTHGRSITIFRGSTFAETFSIDHSFSLFQFGHYSFSSLFNVPFTIYDVVSSTAPYGMGDVIAIAILALIIAICAAVIAITWD